MLMLADMQGRVVAVRSSVGNNVFAPKIMGGLPAGVYTLRWVVDGRRTATKKLLILH